MSARAITVLVCGGRKYADKEWLEHRLSQLHEVRAFGLLIHGGAKGADHLASLWAKSNGVATLCFPANWKARRATGPMRNKQMLAEGRPDLVIAFDGGAGTANMIDTATRAGVQVIEIEGRKP